MVALTALPSSPSDSSPPGKVFWVKKAACIPAKGVRSGGDLHRWSLGLWPCPWPAGLLEPGQQPLLLLTVALMVCFRLLQFAWFLSSQPSCHPSRHGMRKLIFFIAFVLGCAGNEA